PSRRPAQRRGGRRGRMTFAPHAPVMETEAVAALAPINNGVYADATFGGGGYARAVLGAANCKVYGFDRDPTAIARAGEWAPAYGHRLSLIERPFADMETALSEQGVSDLNGIVFDLGVSSMQFDEADRGFSFRHDGPLSMRMDGGAPNAADIVNEADVGDLAAIFKVFGEEKRAGKIARAIVDAREEARIATTTQLADIIAKAAPAKPQDRIHPATRAFQALRIFVNDELRQLVDALAAAERLLRPAGRLVVVTFHSLEDRIVKRFFADRCAATPGGSRHAPPQPLKEPTFRHLFAKAVTPSAAEIADNPRARSAKLRAGIRLNAAARPDMDAFAAPKPLLTGSYFKRK
ncbi:MAG: 16S rRNA (cytosine(1402)-N(4))-methyltransferase RsmH, partial [Pseudomonadota bacterium]